jgi:hypothetical protein
MQWILVAVRSPEILVAMSGVLSSGLITFFLGATLERLHYSRCSLQESTFNVQYFHDFTTPKHWTARAARVDHQRLDGVEWSMGALVLVVLLRGGAIVGNGFILVVDV